MTHQSKHSERDAAIVAQRKAGRTLRSIATEFGVSFESVRRIECVAERRQREAEAGVVDLPVRTRNAIANVVGIDHYGPITEADEPELIKRVVAAGRDAFIGANNVGKKTLLEIDAWLARHGAAWR